MSKPEMRTTPSAPESMQRQAASAGTDDKDTATNESKEGGSESYSLGVLLVHGIGMQPRGDTLQRFGGTLTDWMGEWTSESGEPRFRVTFEDAAARDRDSPGGRGPTHAAIKISESSNGDASVRWLLAESWWAEEFLTPTYKDLLRWTFHVVPWTIAAHFSTRAQHALQRLNSSKGLPDKAFAISRAFLLEPLALVLGMLSIPILILALGGVFLLSLIPAAGVRAFTRKAQSVLTGTVGDSFVLVDKPIQRAAILRRIRKDYEWLRDTKKCEKVAIVAHSQGAAIAHRTIRESSSVRPDLLLTFGSGLNKLTRVEAIRRSGKRIFPWIAAGGLAVLGLFTWLAISSGAVETMPFLGILLALLASAALATVLYDKGLTGLEGRRPQTTDDYGERGRSPTPRRATVVWTYGARGLLILAVPSLAFWMVIAVGWLGVVPLIGLALFLIGMVLCTRKIEIAREAFDLPGPGKWLDVYTRVDPVPNGPPAGAQNVCEAFEIANRGSLITDHSAYWKNPDGFVSLAAARLFELGGLKIEDLNDDRLTRVRRRRVWRVGWHRAMRRAVTAMAVLVLAILGSQMEAVGADIPGWLHRSLNWGLPKIAAIISAVPLIGDGNVLGAMSVPTPAAVGATTVLLGFLVGYFVLSMAWTAWNGSEVKRFYAGEGFPSLGFYMRVFLLLSLVVVLMTLVSLLRLPEAVGLGVLIAGGVVALGLSVLVAVLDILVPRGIKGDPPIEKPGFVLGIVGRAPIVFFLVIPALAQVARACECTEWRRLLSSLASNPTMPWVVGTASTLFALWLIAHGPIAGALSVWWRDWSYAPNESDERRPGDMLPPWLKSLVARIRSLIAGGRVGRQAAG